MNIATARQRSEIINKVRRFFEEINVLEVETPILSHSGTADCHLDSFTTEFHQDGFTKTENSETVFLQTSPEFAMKRLLTAGYGDIYQICKVFRNGEQGTIHNPEFTMLEWYRVGFSMNNLIGETAQLLKIILGNKPVIVKKYEDLFLETLAINPLSTNKEAVVEACAKKDLTAPACATLTDALQFAMASIIEPGLSKDSIVFVTHYPADQAVFAVLEPTSPNVARRFEAYFGGVELVNGFEELGDARENEQRMKQENVRRQAISKPEIPLDRNFLSSLKNGLPHCSGAALGLDRLVMLALNKTNTGDVIAFHWDLC